MKHDSRKAPLRKIVGKLRLEAGIHLGPGELEGCMVYTEHELLECFHHQLPVQDMIGETYAVRRRCNDCAIERAKEMEGK